MSTLRLEILSRGACRAQRIAVSVLMVVLCAAACSDFEVGDEPDGASSATGGGSCDGCAPGIPEGWSGPAALFVGAELPASCPAGYDGESVLGGVGALDAQPASCSRCDCEAPVGQTCGTTNVVRWTSTNCSGTPSMDMVEPDVCKDVADTTAQSAQADNVPATGGSCRQTGGAPTLQPPSFEERGMVCLGAAGAAAPPAPFRSDVCVYKSGDVDCPHDYTEREVIFSDVADTRGCAPCTCTDPTGGFCGGFTKFFDDNTCGHESANVPNNDGQCEAYSIFKSINSIMVTAGEIVGGECQSGGGEPEGEAKAAEPLTVCCLP